jgi:NAD-dependent SIR2 family protein deacetylase
MGDINFECVICKSEFKADEYDDNNQNKCPECGQVYNYDEALTIELTKAQLDLLRENNAELFKQEDL